MTIPTFIQELEDKLRYNLATRENVSMTDIIRETIEETLLLVEGIAKSDATLASAHTLIHKKRYREVTLEDDAVCKCFREVFLKNLAELRGK